MPAGRRLWRGEPLDPDDRVAGAPTKEAAFPFIEHDEFDFVAARAEFCERSVKCVFDGSSACFDLIHG